jgi:hypothetical protein
MQSPSTRRHHLDETTRRQYADMNDIGGDKNGGGKWAELTISTYRAAPKWWS